MKTQLFRGIMALFLISLLFTGCNTGNKKVAENDITFDSIVVKEAYHLLENPENPNCDLQIKFNYPVKFANKEVLQKIQKEFVVAYFGENYEKLTPQEAVDKYTKDYLKAYKELEPDLKAELAKSDDAPIAAWFSYYEMSTNQIVYNEKGLLSYIVNFENYTGGAHGSHSHTNHVVNLKTGMPITEEEIFNEDYQDTLAQLLVDKIAKQNKVDDAKELENVGFFSVDEIFPNGNFLVDNTGITYTYNEYEIAAYVVGATRVHLPFEEIKFLLKKESPISQLF
ncbi:MAG: DUF4163 domain-containing protein [Tannerellaceae bacterium]